MIARARKQAVKVTLRSLCATAATGDLLDRRLPALALHPSLIDSDRLSERQSEATLLARQSAIAALHFEAVIVCGANIGRKKHNKNSGTHVLGSTAHLRCQL
jgi:hypothetical protein